MVIGIITFVILLALIVGAAAAGLNVKKRIISNACLALAIIFTLSLIAIPFSFHTIDSGEVAVVKHLGKITHTRTAGTNFDLWILNSYKKYDAKVRNVQINTAAYSSDAQTMEIEMTLQYQIATDRVIDIATQYGDIDVLENRITSIATEKTKSVMSSYKAMDIIANRASISPAVEDVIMDAIGAEYFVNVHAVVLTNIDFSDAFELAVEEKMIAEQTKLKADYENDTKVAKAEAEAEAKIKAAEAEIEIAKAQAEAKKITAEGEAEANKIVDASLTDRIIEKTLVDNWNGELPTVVGDGDYILPSNILG